MRQEPSAAARTRWLAELSQALADAQALLWGLGAAGFSPEALSLYGQIEAALAEVRSLKLQENRRANQLPWLADATSWPPRLPSRERA